MIQCLRHSNLQHYCIYLTCKAEVPVQAENFRRTKLFAERLAEAHPLLSSFSRYAKSLKQALKHPTIQQMAFRDWEKYYEKIEAGDPSRLGISMGFWNRQHDRSQRITMDIEYNADWPGCENRISFSILPAEIFDPAIAQQIISAGIDCFGAYRGESCWYDYDRQFKFSHHTLWMADDLPFPTGNDLGRYQPNHPPPLMSEPWHGGTRYIWPEHDPRILMKEYG